MVSNVKATFRPCNNNLPMSDAEIESWSPRVTRKQAEAINLIRQYDRMFNLLSGPRLTGKTVGCLDILADHAWLTPNANIAMVSVTQSAGFDSGVWTDMTEMTLSNWIGKKPSGEPVEGGGNFGMEWKVKPSIQSVSKKPYCIVTNSHGNYSKFQLESLKNENEVEARFKSKRYTAIFVNELSNFKKRKTFETFTECLRTIGLPRERHLFLADTNPADEGTKSWIYQLWFNFPNLRDIDGRDLTAEEKWLQNQLRVIQFTLDDNTLIDPDRIMQLKASLSGNPDLYARYVMGRWVTASMDALFLDVFKEHRHAVPDPSSPSARHLVMVPEEKCFELFTGWDAGVVNSAACVIERAWREIPGQKSVSVFKILDEQVIIGEPHSLEEFTIDFVAEKMDFWETFISGQTKWNHWSDRSAFDMRDPQHNRLHHQTVFLASDGRIELQAAARGRDSVRQRVDLVRKLLFQNRLFVSSDKCPMALEMFKSIRKGKTTSAIIEKGSRMKHIFDAISYVLVSECASEIQENIYHSVRAERVDNGGLVNISM